MHRDRNQNTVYLPANHFTAGLIDSFYDKYHLKPYQPFRGCIVDMRVSLRSGKAQSIFTWEAGHSSLWLGLMRKNQRDRKPQMRTEAVYVALCIPDCPCVCLVYPQGKQSDAPGLRNTAVQYPVSTPICTFCRWNFRAALT